MLTAEAKARRRHFLGSSDAAPALGLSQYKSPYELWLEKTGQLVEEDLGDNLAVMLGNGMERVILDAAFQRLVQDKRVEMVPIECAGMLEYAPVRERPGTPLAMTADALIYDLEGFRIPLEAKYTESPERWGPASDGLDGLPPEYAPQILHQLVVTGSPRGFVAAYFAGRRRELRIYEIAPAPEMLAAYERTAVEWWQKHVVGMVPPSQDKPCDLDVLSRIIRTPGKSVALPDELVQSWRDLDAAAAVAKAEAEVAKEQVIQALGDAEEGVCALGTLTYREVQRKGYSVPAGSYRRCHFKATAIGGAA